MVVNVVVGVVVRVVVNVVVGVVVGVVVCEVVSEVVVVLLGTLPSVSLMSAVVKGFGDQDMPHKLPTVPRRIGSRTLRELRDRDCRGLSEHGGRPVHAVQRGQL